MNEELFTGKTNFYEMARPKVSKEAVDYLCSLLPEDAVFADIGAGTGKFTSLIADRGYRIYAVEPNNDMYAVLYNKLSKYSNVELLNKSAEKTGILTGSVDAIVVVTALHWFDLEIFKKECLRILKPNGMVVIIYNSRKSELKKIDVHSKKLLLIFFGGENCDVFEFKNEQLYSREEFVAYYLSHSSAPNEGDEEYPAYVKEINALFDKNCTDDSYIFDFVSMLYIDKKFVEHNSICL